MPNYRAEEYLLNAARLRQMARNVSSGINRAALLALAIKWEDMARYVVDRQRPAAVRSNGTKM